MNDAFEKAADDLMPRLGMTAPRAGSNRVWPGLSDRLQTAPQWLGLQRYLTSVSLTRPGVAEVRWVGEEAIVGLFVSSLGDAELRRALVLAALFSTHAPTTALEPGTAALGDGSFTIAGAIYYFSRGNLGAMVRSQNQQKPAADIAKLIDDAMQKEQTIEPSALAGRLPKIADLRASRADVPVGETVRVTLTIDPAWVDRAGPFFDYSTEFLNADFPEEHFADLTGIEPGNARVYGCAVDRKTLLSSSRMVAVAVLPGQKPPAPQEQEEEGPIVD